MSVTSALSRLPAPRTEDNLDAGGWGRWLRDHLDSAWRTNEWRQDCWLFTGSVHEPRSSVALCRTAACDTVVSLANIFCPFCKEAQKASPLPDAEFARTFVPVRTRVPFGGVPEQCSFTKDGQRCIRPRHCKGLCVMHHTQRKTHTTRKLAGQWEDKAVPYTDIPACPVLACPLPSLQARGLCRHRCLGSCGANPLVAPPVPLTAAAGPDRSADREGPTRVTMRQHRPDQARNPSVDTTDNPTDNCPRPYGG